MDLAPLEYRRQHGHHAGLDRDLSVDPGTFLGCGSRPVPGRFGPLASTADRACPGAAGDEKHPRSPGRPGPFPGAGEEFSYAVKVFNRKGQTAGLSNIATLWLQPVPQSPGRPRLNPAEEFVEISWAPSTTNIDGSPVAAGVAFNLYRAPPEGSPAGSLLNATPVAGTSYRDGSVRLGETYVYRVRAVLETDRGKVESRDSEEATLFHRDVFPPRPPRRLALVVGREYLSLAWYPNSEADLAGYHVFRRQGRGDFQRLTATATQRTSYEDRDLLKGPVYSYRVTAVDRAGNKAVFRMS